jgi:SAM-dependent methyltransferase
VNIIPSPTHSRTNVTEPWRSGYGSDLYDAIAEFGIAAGREVLDVGCGIGHATEPLAVRGCIVTGLDPDAARLASAQERLPNLRFVQGRAEELPFADNTFDGAICAQAYHRFDQVKAMDELMRVVRPGRPVAIWWKALSSSERAREAREHASLRAGRPPLPDSLKSGFKAFYGAPFADRRVRVLRYVVFTTVDQWMAYERTSGRAIRHFGANFEKYLTTLETELRTSYGDGEMQATYIQYLYVGLVP